MNIAMLLEMAADGMGDRIGVGPQTSGLTYAGLLDRSRRVATLARETGVERLGLVAANSDRTCRPCSSAARSPACRLRPSTTVWLTIACRPSAPGSRRPSLSPIPTRLARVSGIDGITVMTNEELADRLAALDPATEGYTDPDQVAIWLFTSGTTGEPKAALLRHRHLVSYVLSTIEYMAADEDEATLVSVPPYHIAGYGDHPLQRLLRAAHHVPAAVRAQGMGARSPTRRASPTPWWCRPCSAGSSMPPGGGIQLPALHHLSYGGGRMPVPIIERAMSSCRRSATSTPTA